MACQSTISSTFKNISRAKARAPGVFPKVVTTVVHMACIAVAGALSIMSLAWVIFRGGLVCTSVLSTLVTVWCILSQIAIDGGFLLIEHLVGNSYFWFQFLGPPSLFDFKDSGRKSFLKFWCLESQKIRIPICNIWNSGNFFVQELSMFYCC